MGTGRLGDLQVRGHHRDGGPPGEGPPQGQGHHRDLQVRGHHRGRRRVDLLVRGHHRDRGWGTSR